MSVLIIQHVDNCPPGTLLSALPEAEVLRMWETPRALAPYLEGSQPLPSGVVILGGTQHAHADEEWPWLPDVRALITLLHETSVPTLGICLGMQIIAVAAGGHVAVGAPAGPEQGITALHWAQDLPAGIPTPGLVFADHGDAVDALPDDVHVLAESALYPHVIQWGSVTAVQYHPEVTPEIVGTWKESYKPEQADAVYNDYMDHRQDLAQHCHDLCDYVFATASPA